MIYAAPSSTVEAVTDAFAHSATVGFRIRDNAGSDFLARTVVGVTEDVTVGSTAVFRKSFTAPSSTGQYTLVWDNGTILDTEELVVTGTPSSVVVSDGTNYISSDSLKTTLSLTGLDFADDDIASAIAAASRWIDNRTGRRFYADDDATSIRYYSPTRQGSVMVDDIATLTSVEVDFNADGTYEETWVENTDFIATPLNRTAPYWPITGVKVHPLSGRFFQVGLPRTVKVTGKFGWASCPDAIVEACTIKAAQLLRRAREAPFGIVSVGVEGQSLRIGGGDRDLDELIGPYIRLTV